MTYAFIDTYAGYPNIEEPFTPIGTSLATLPIAPGFIAAVLDPLFGPGEVVWARAGAGIRVGGLCVLTPSYDATNFTMQQNMTEASVAVNQGRAVYVYAGRLALTVGQYGWFIMTGVAPMSCNVYLVQGTALGIAAVGQGGAFVASRAINGAVVAAPSTQTVVRNGTGVAADNQIFFQGGTQGLFPGAFVSGTGVGAAAVITQVLNDRILVSVVNSAAIGGAVTQTANNAVIFYNYVALNRPQAQGPIT